MSESDRDGPDIAEAIEVVLGFVDAKNQWESRMYQRSRIDSGRFVSEENRHRVEGWTVERLNAAYHEILVRYCTQRERKLGGNPWGSTKAGKYRGVSRATILQAVKVRTDRIEIDARGESFGGQLFRFVLFKKRGAWLIDNVLSRVRETDEWDRDYL